MEDVFTTLTDASASALETVRNSQLTPVVILLTCMLLTGLIIILLSYGTSRSKGKPERKSYSRDRVQYSIITTDFDDQDDDDDESFNALISKQTIG